MDGDSGDEGNDELTCEMRCIAMTAYQRVMTNTYQLIISACTTTHTKYSTSSVMSAQVAPRLTPSIALALSCQRRLHHDSHQVQH